MKKSHKIDKFFFITILLIVILVFVYFIINRNGNNFSVTNVEQTEESPEEGVKVEVIKEGEGEVAGVGDEIAVNYIGSFSNGEIFESNIGEEPYVLTLGTTPVIKGWGMGVTGMKVGEKRMIEINPEYAYGDKGIPGVVPPYTTLFYEIDLVAIKN